MQPVCMATNNYFWIGHRYCECVSSKSKHFYLSLKIVGWANKQLMMCQLLQKSDLSLSFSLSLSLAAVVVFDVGLTIKSYSCLCSLSSSSLSLFPGLIQFSPLSLFLLLIFCRSLPCCLPKLILHFSTTFTTGRIEREKWANQRLHYQAQCHSTACNGKTNLN